VKARCFNALLLLHQRLQLAVHVADLKHKWHERLFKLALGSGIQHKPPPRCLSDEFVNSLGQGQELLLSNEGLFCPLHSGFQLCLQNLVFCLCSHHLSYHLQPVAASKNCDQRGAVAQPSANELIDSETNVNEREKTTHSAGAQTNLSESL
jgi:hypothetical protein